MVSNELSVATNDCSLALKGRALVAEDAAPMSLESPSGVRSGTASSTESRPPLTVERFIELLGESALLSAEEMDDVRVGLPQNHTVESLAESLYRSGKLTKYQLTRVIQGKAKSLHLGNYTVVDKIGQGGMGLVVKARHRVMQRMVAIKILAASAVKSPDSLKRFHREVEAAARLNHPHIVAAFDADQANGTHFLVMEYVDGYNFAHLVRVQGPLSIKRVIEFMLQAGRGLEFAHARGVIHRDIKPANLLIDRSGTVKILDLGLARLSNSEQPTDLTSSGQIMGTIDYMAPEQAVNTRTADHRSDIYSFGCTLWYLLTGKSVYYGETALAKLLEHREGAIPSLLGMNEELNAADPRAVAIDRVIRKMLAKRPDQRYQSMAEVLIALEGCLSGKSDTAEMEIVEPHSHGEPLTAYLSFLSAGVAADINFQPRSASSDQTALMDLSVLNRDSRSFSLAPEAKTSRTVSPIAFRRPASRSNPLWIGLFVGAAGLLILITLLVISSLPGNAAKATPPAIKTPLAPAGIPPEQLPQAETTGFEQFSSMEVAGSSSKPDDKNGSGQDHREFQLAFNGTDSYMQVESLQYVHGEAYTCEGWFTVLPGIRNAPSDPLIWTGTRWIAIWEQSHRFGVGLTGSGPNAIFASSQTVPALKPVHVAGIWKGTEQTLFINGRKVELTDTKSAPFPVTTGGFFLGGAPESAIGHSRWYRGGIDEVRISRGTRYRMNFAPSPRFSDTDPDTLALYHFDDMNGVRAIDSSGHGHHGKIVNAKWIPAALPFNSRVSGRKPN